jgi:hypothetical protein
MVKICPANEMVPELIAVREPPACAAPPERTTSPEETVIVELVAINPKAQPGALIASPEAALKLRPLAPLSVKVREVAVELTLPL